MAAVPSVKGSLIAASVEDIKKLLQAGTLSESELERRLQPGDLEVLARGVSMMGWYDIRIHARMLELLKDAEGGGSDDYLRQRGAQSAERLLDAGLYQQLEYLNRTQLSNTADSLERFLAFGRDLRLLTTLSGSIYNFMRWESQIDPEVKNRYLIRVSEATAFPDDMGWAAEGFINRMAMQHGDPDLWRWQRPAPDLIVFRMIRDL
jgi:hypothetical protein